MPSEFVKKHFDKLLLVSLFFFMLLFTLIIVTAGIFLQTKVDPSNVAWCRETAGTILGALIGLISGMAARAGATPAVPAVPESPDEAAVERAVPPLPPH